MCHLKIVLYFELIALISAREPKIVGGGNASITDYPFQVSLQINGSHFCGGCIYNSRIIVTAAHCVAHMENLTDLQIRYGSSDRQTNGTVIGVSKIKVHPDYNRVSMDNDIALLKTSVPIVWSATAKSIYMAHEEPANNSKCRISGWGTMSFAAPTIPVQLQEATVKIISRSACQSETYRYGSVIGNSMICAAAPGVGGCNGDSGGPLVATNGALVGVTSWNSGGCANPLYPTVYTSVAVVKDFITINAKLL